MEWRHRTKPQSAPSKIPTPFVLGLALFAITVVVFLRVGGNGFLIYDDPVYVTNNQYVKAGLTLKGIAWALTSGHGGNWHPLTWISHMLDSQLFGQNPGAHHLISVLFHAANALLLLLVLARSTGARWPSAFAAALFALHPLRVESVAWVAERKDVLSGLFWMLSMLSYVWYAERPSLRRLALCLVFFVLGLAAKPMLVTLPFVLLLFDIWPLGRLRLRSEGQPRGPAAPVENGEQKGAAKPGHPASEWRKGEQSGRDRGRSQMERNGDGLKNSGGHRGFGSGEQETRNAHARSLGQLVLEKIPFLALAIASSVVTLYVQRAAGAVVATSGAVRLTNAVVVYVSYIMKMIWPSGLIVLYMHPGLRPAWEIVGAGAILLVLTAVVLRTAGRTPYLAVGWLWYLGTLVPVIGLVQVGIQAMADRYTYVPLIGVAIMLAWGAADLARAWRIPQKALAGLAAVVIAACAIATWHQIGYWTNDLAIFQHAVAVSNGNVMALCNLGKALEKQGRLEEAIDRYRQALSILPDDPEIRGGLGSALAKRGSLDEAAAQYLAALRFEPKDVESCFGLANIYLKQGKLDEAIGRYEEVLRIEPRLAEAHNNLGGALARTGRTSEAIRHFEETLRIDPEHAGAHVNLGALLLEQGRAAEAAAHFSEALRIRPSDARARDGLVRAGRSGASKETNGGR